MPDDAGVGARLRDQRALDAALPGLRATPKTLPAKLLYDATGCALFKRITGLPEYYLTRTETALLKSIAPAIAEMTLPGGALVEYGASDEGKADLLLRQRASDGRELFSTYVPIDVAEDALRGVCVRLAHVHPKLHVAPVIADFLQPFELPPLEGQSRLGFFPGSTIGNLEPAEAQSFLARMRATLGIGARFLVGVDLRKDPDILLPAYNDAEGVTAAFNINLLTRLNREAAADFDVDSFHHCAVWNDRDSRIEMHLRSTRAQIVRVGGREISFAAGETIHTENSYKWTAGDFIRLARRASWRVLRVWMDPANLFSLHFLEAT
jgi:dimethylhistidine N-methyltransferase